MISDLQIICQFKRHRLSIDPISRGWLDNAQLSPSPHLGIGRWRKDYAWALLPSLEMYSFCVCLVPSFHSPYNPIETFGLLNQTEIKCGQGRFTSKRNGGKKRGICSLYYFLSPFCLVLCSGAQPQNIEVLFFFFSVPPSAVNTEYVVQRSSTVMCTIISSYLGLWEFELPC